MMLQQENRCRFYLATVFGTFDVIFLTESSKSPASIARSKKQWVGLTNSNEWQKDLFIGDI